MKMPHNANIKHFVLRFSAIILLCVLLTSCASSAEKAKEKIELGQKYLLEMNYTEAVISFSDAIKLDPNNADLYVQRGDVYMLTEQYDEAFADFNKAAKLGTAQQSTRAEIENRIKKAIDLGINIEMKENGFDSALAWLDKIGYSSSQVYNDLKEINTAMDSIMELLRSGNNDAVCNELERLSKSSLFDNLSLGVDEAVTASDAAYNTLLEEYGLSEHQNTSMDIGVYAAGLVELRKIDLEADKLLTLVGYSGEMVIGEKSDDGELSGSVQFVCAFYGSHDGMEKAGDGIILGYASGETVEYEKISEQISGDGICASDKPNGKWNMAYNITNEAVDGQMLNITGSASGTMVNGVWEGPFTTISEQTEQGVLIKFTTETTAFNGKYNGATKYTVVITENGNTMTQISEGTLTNNEPTGVWTTRQAEGSNSFVNSYRYDYDTGTASYYLEGYGWMTDSQLQSLAGSYSQ